MLGFNRMVRKKELTAGPDQNLFSLLPSPDPQKTILLPTVRQPDAFSNTTTRLQFSDLKRCLFFSWTQNAMKENWRGEKEKEKNKKLYGSSDDHHKPDNCSMKLHFISPCKWACFPSRCLLKRGITKDGGTKRHLAMQAPTLFMNITVLRGKRGEFAFCFITRTDWTSATCQSFEYLYSFFPNVPPSCCLHPPGWAAESAPGYTHTICSQQPSIACDYKNKCMHGMLVWRGAPLSAPAKWSVRLFIFSSFQCHWGEFIGIKKKKLNQ